MQEETCWLLYHSSDLQTKIYIIYLVDKRDFAAVWRACVKGTVSLTAYSDLALSSFTLQLYFQFPPGLLPAQFLVSHWMPETSPHCGVWEVHLLQMVPVLSPSFVGAVFVGAGHFPVFGMRRGR